MIAEQITGQLEGLLRKNVIFSILDDDAIRLLASKLTMQTFSMGENVVNEGEPGDCAYLVLSGRLRVIKRGETGKPVTLGTLSAGDFFGEQAILTEQPRNATVRVSEGVVLFRIDHTDFEDLLNNYPDLRPYFEQYMQERWVVNFLRLATFVGSLKPAEVTELLDQLEPCEFRAAETIIREGEIGDRLYIIASGEVKAVQLKNGSEKLFRYLGEGEYFGERALILQEPRSASVIATQDTRCFSLSREKFEKLIESAPNIKEQLTKRIEQYNISAELEDKFGLKPPTRIQRRQLTFGSVTQTAPKQAKTIEEELKPAERKAKRQKLRTGRRLFKKYPWIRQHDETDCGAASLAMVSKYYGINLSVGGLRDMANVGREGASLYSLATAADTLGYNTRAVRTDYDNLANLELPAVAHWMGYHYVVLYEVRQDKVIVGDPARGLIRMSRKEFEEGWTGRLLLLNPTTRLEENEPEKTTMRRFLPLLRPHKSLLFEILIASLALEFLQLASPIFTQTVVDKVLVHQNVNMLNIMLGGMVIIGIFQTAIGLLRQYLLIHVSQKLELRLASDLFHRIMKLPMRFFHTRQIGDLLQRFQDNDQIQQTMTGRAISTILDVMMLFTTLSLMLYYNAKLTLVALITIPFYVVLTLAFTPFLKRNNQREFEQEAKTESSLVESIQSVETLKACVAENSAQWQYEDHIVKAANIEIHGAKLGMSLSGTSGTLAIFSSTFLLWYGAHLVIQGELTVGQLMAFQALIGMVTAPIMALIGLWDELQDTMLSLQRLNDIYGSELEQDPDRQVVHMPQLRGYIKFENVSFRYNTDDDDILSGVNLEIQPGETLAIVGRSGSGKSTLVRLLQRFYLPTEGRILVDGHDLATVDVKSYREQVGVVSQESTIFSGTIKENIAMTDPEASMDRIIGAARLANADEFIRAFPMSYDTVVGDVGVQLSGGQKQRLCIARALLRDPQILIFDEATSALDTESEKMIQQNMQAILAQRTAIMIAHRLSTIQNADTIIVLEDGMIVEKGSHRELLEKKGLYYYLNSQQLTM